MHSKYEISIVNHADPANADHWVKNVSKRRQRALKLARQLRKDGNANVILWSVHHDGQRFPVSLLQESNVEFVAKHSNLTPAREAVSRQIPSAANHRPVSDDAVDAFRGMLAARLVRQGIV